MKLMNKDLRLLVTLYLSVSMTTAFSSRTLAVPSSVRALPVVALQAGITTYLDDNNYHETIHQSDKKLVLVDACAQWCGPCKLIEPFLLRSAELYQDDLKVVKFDVDAEDTSDVQVEFLLQGALPQALPHLILFHEGKAVAVHSGVLKQEHLNNLIEESLMKIQSTSDNTDKLAVEPKRMKAHELVGAGLAFEEDVGETKKGFISFGGSNQPDDYALSLSF